jgi:hypothetical protein
MRWKENHPIPPRRAPIKQRKVSIIGHGITPKNEPSNPNSFIRRKRRAAREQGTASAAKPKPIHAKRAHFRIAIRGLAIAKDSAGGGGAYRGLLMLDFWGYSRARLRDDPKILRGITRLCHRSLRKQK